MTTATNIDLTDEIADVLRDADVAAHPCPWIGAVSIFVDEYYENFDYDIVGPKARLAIARALEARGYRQRSGRIFEGDAGRVEFPKPSRTLSSDPAGELELVLQRPRTIALATPTQVVLTTWRRDGPNISDDRLDDLQRLIVNQPANLDKVWDWLRRTDTAESFKLAHPTLAAAQAEGVEQRRRSRRQV
jgi:hypothetical protein